ncbi:hypothetical protein TorRG33x02_261960, partial [Trema orientale]
ARSLKANPPIEFVGSVSEDRSRFQEVEEENALYGVYSVAQLAACKELEYHA